MKLKVGLLALATSIAIGTTIIPVQAREVNFEVNCIENLSDRISPMADVIVRIYRSNGKILQYRRWNETRGYWVDSDWITM